MNFDFIIGNQGAGSRFRGPDSGPIDPTRVLEYKSPELVVISRRQQPAIDVMQTQTELWSLLYQDSLAQVWGIKSKFDNPRHDSYLPPSSRQISDQPQTGYATWPALPQPLVKDTDHEIQVAAYE